MTAFAKDVSNYSVTFSPDLLAGWAAAGTRLVILQCFPPNYAQYTIQRHQMDVCAAAGMPWDVYLYDYLGDSAWRDGALAGLDMAAADGLVPRKLWLDEEDVTSENGWTPEQRVAAIEASLQAADAWLTAHGRPPAGIYAAAWWWGPRTGNSTAFADRQWWAAQYDGVADASVITPVGGWDHCAIKQYAGSQPDGTDLDVLSVEEEAELNGGGGEVPDPSVDYVWQAKKDSVVATAGELLTVADQLLTEANRKNGPRVTEIRRLANPEVRARAEKILS